MFVGHFGVGLAAKKVTPGVSLGLLFAAAQFADLLWPTLVLLGVERVEIHPGITVMTPLDFVHYPYSHSLVALVLWGIILGSVYAWLKDRQVISALTIAVLVVSHWILDAVVHRPDLPITLGGELRVGLGLWNSPAGTLLVEIAIFLAGVWTYVRTTMARDRIGRVGCAALVVFLLTVYLANSFGPPPPSVGAVAWSAEAMWLLVVWAFWVDRHRLVNRHRAPTLQP